MICQSLQRDSIERHLIQEIGSPEHYPSNPSPTFWFVPFSRNRFFTGREAELSALYDLFHLPGDQTQARVQVICGAGGIGKTQLALEYAYRFRDEYTAVLWLRTETPETLLADLRELMDALALPEKQGCEQHQICAAVKRWFSEQANWLLILDNIENFALVSELQPLRYGGHVLLTNRRHITDISQRTLNLQTWSAEDGVLFLLRRARLLSLYAPLEDAAVDLRQQAEGICQELGGWPLALDQAGAYIMETGCTLVGYQQRFQMQQVLLLSQRGNESFAHPESVMTTILQTVECVERQFPSAAELLRLSAFLASEAIPEELLTKQSAEILGPVLYASATDPFELDTICATFHATSLLERNAQTRLLTIPRLVQTVLLAHMDRETRQQWARRALLAVDRVFPVIGNEISSVALSSSEQLLPHALLTLTRIDHFLPAEQEAAMASVISDLLFKVSSYLALRGAYQKAQCLLERCLPLREQTLGAMHPAVAEPLARVGYLLRVQGRYTDAQARLERALAIYEQASLSTSPFFGSVLTNLALISLDRGCYEQAETLMKRVISIEEQLQGAENRVPLLLTDLAIIYRRQGRHQEAKALLQHAVHLQEQVFGPEYPGLSAVLNNLANFYWEQGKYAQAEPLYLRALQLGEQNQPLDASQIAAVLFHLGELYRKLERYEEAESYYQRALSTFEQTAGPGHLLTSYALHGLAKLRAAQSQPEEAEQFFRKTIHIRGQAYSEAYADLVEAICDLATLYSKQGKEGVAQHLFARAFQIRKQSLGSRSSALTTSRHYLGLF